MKIVQDPLILFLLFLERKKTNKSSRRDLRERVFNEQDYSVRDLSTLCSLDELDGSDPRCRTPDEKGRTQKLRTGFSSQQYKKTKVSTAVQLSPYRRATSRLSENE